MTLRLLLFLFALTLTSAADREAPPAPGRLGDGVRPTLQKLTLELDPSRSDYRGSTRIALQTKKRVSSFRLHAQDLRLEKVAVSKNGRAFAARAVPESLGVVVIQLDQPLEPGAFQLDIEFSNEFDTKAASLYKLWTGGHSYAFTQFEADDARAAFPCFDEPAFKIPWDVTIRVPKKQLAVSNAPVARETVEGEWKKFEFRRTPPLSSYFVAFAAGPLDTVAIPGLRVPGRVITVKGQTRLAAEAIRMTPPILLALERYFGRRYPYEKLDLIAVPEFWYGAMENAGAITFADRVLLIDPAAVTVRQRSRLADVLAHELAHMWFGDLVTMKWWDDLWLNESFASWLGTKVVDQVHPEFGAGLEGVAGRRTAMNLDARLSTRAVRQAVTGTDNLLQLADALAYNKGQAVLGMIERWIGEDRFRSGVADYMELYAWSNADGADLWKTLSKASGEDVSRTLPTFLDQPGIPLVTADRMGDGKVRLRQQRFLNHGLAAPAPQLWRIPVILRYGEGAASRTHSVLLTREEQVVKLDAGATLEWLHPNADETGYYRWTMPERDLQALAARARKVMSPRERIGFVDNLAALLDAGTLHGDAYLANLALLADDPEPEVVGAVLDGLKRVKDTFVDDGLEETYARFVRRTLQPALERFGESPRAGEPESVPPLRVRLLDRLADDGRDQALLARLETLARAYLADSTSIPADLRDAVVPAAALRGDAVLFDEYVRRFERTTVPDDRRRFLNALGRFRDLEVLRGALDYTRSGKLQPQELTVVPLVASTSDQRRALIQRYWMEHFEEMTSRIPPMFKGFLPRIADGCSAERLEEARKFFADPAHQGPGWEREMAQVAERVQQCTSLRAREGAAVRRFLEAAPGAP